VLRRIVDRFLAEGDPRRFYIAQVILYGSTFIAIAVSVWAGTRGVIRRGPDSQSAGAARR
jgi:hypothetical protein